MAFKFDIRETFLKAIPRIARERIDRVIESLSEKPHPGAESIHEARKDLKSLRALMRLVRGSIDDGVRERENLFFREAGRSLSTIRDPQALLETLEHFNSQHRDHSSLSTSKQKSFGVFNEKIRGEIEKNLVVGLAPGTVRKLLKELRVAKRRMALWFEGVLARPGDEWEIFVGTGLRRTYRKARNLVWQFEMMGHETADDQSWHELRKCAKALGYQLRLLKTIWPAMMSALVDELDRLADRLGNANDLAMLRDKILDEPYDRLEPQETGEVRRFFLQTLDRRKQKLHTEAFELARLIYAEKPGQFERRLAGYWQIRHPQEEMKVDRNSGIVDRPIERQQTTGRKARSEILSSSPVVNEGGGVSTEPGSYS
jgi:CHAD domain-containing protein